MPSRNHQPALQTDVALASSFVTVGATSTVVVGNHPARVEIVLVNDSANTIYLQLATANDATSPGAPTAPTAVSGQGIRLNANGGAWTSVAYTGPIAAIASGSSNLCVGEL